MIIDNIAVNYDSFETLMERQSVIEQTALDYLEKHPEMADRIETKVKVTKDKYVLQIDLIKD